MTNLKNISRFYLLYWFKHPEIYQFLILSVLYYALCILNYNHNLINGIFILSLYVLILNFFNDRKLRNNNFFNILGILRIEIWHSKLILLFSFIVSQLLIYSLLDMIFEIPNSTIQYSTYYNSIFLFFYFVNVYKIRFLALKIATFIIYLLGIAWLVSLKNTVILTIAFCLLILLTILINKNEYRNRILKC